MKSDILMDVTTDTARENSGALINNFDKNKVQSEINLQVEVTKHFDANRQEVKQEIYKKFDSMRAEAKKIRQEKYFEKKASGVTTGVAIPVSAPFALADLISSDVLQLILGLGK